MAIWGMGVMMGPIMGPSLGAWLTETYSWHWVFFVNLPFGIITVVGLIIFMDETRLDTGLQFDWFGFGALAVGIGALQLALDRGEQLDWFESWEIVIELIVSGVGFYYFFAHSLTTKRPFVQFAIFKDRNFATALIFMAVIGVVLFSTMALASPLFQNAYGYPILTAGLLLATRGGGTFVAMMMVSRLMSYFEARTLIATGLSLIAITLYGMTGWTADVSVQTIVINSIVQGFGIGLVFVPLTTAAFMTLPNHLRTDGTSMLTLVRNVASSIGISIVIAQLTSGTTPHPCGAGRAHQPLQQRIADAERRKHHQPEHGHGPCDDGPDRQRAGADHRVLAGLRTGRAGDDLRDSAGADPEIDQGGDARAGRGSCRGDRIAAKRQGCLALNALRTDAWKTCTAAVMPRNRHRNFVASPP